MTVKAKRPRAPFNDPATQAEKNILKQRHRDIIEYIETYGLGLGHARGQVDGENDQGEKGLQQGLEDVFNGAMNILDN
jgi:hypothetical protein